MYDLELVGCEPPTLILFGQVVSGASRYSTLNMTTPQSTAASTESSVSYQNLVNKINLESNNVHIA